ncbi:MAG: hypothetical protein JSR54_09230 [Proteobacteria bacterium]|nr:hypothetical protein [Pseudomonadota bacterium]
MLRGKRWALVAMFGGPLLSMTAYLLWIWPRPRSASVIAELLPYAVCLLTGLPFAWIASAGRRRALWLLAYLAGGFMALWIQALAVLCGVRNVCL